MKSGLNIVIDLDFDGLMNVNEQKSLCQQLSYAYGAVNKAEQPPHLHLLGVRGELSSLLHKQCSGVDNWYVTKREAPWAEHFKVSTWSHVMLRMCCSLNA